MTAGRRDGSSLSARRAGQSLYDYAIDVLLNGVGLIVPAVVTLYVLTAAFQFIFAALNPFIKLLQWAGLIEGIRQVGVVQFLLRADLIVSPAQFATELISLFVLVAVVVAVGMLARVGPGEQLIALFDRLISAVPGVGSVYMAFRRMSDAMLDSEAQNFQDVKLVEFPREGTYVLGFRTADSPEAVARTTGHDEMETLFLPLAPNPVMGGFLAHIPAERVSDVDMTVEEGIRSIITSGVAADAEDADEVDDRLFLGVEELVRRDGEAGAVSRVRGALDRQGTVLGRESDPDDDPAGRGGGEAEVPTWEVTAGGDDAGPTPDEPGEAEETRTGETD
jgi:uncharacterized membrane protein